MQKYYGNKGLNFTFVQAAIIHKNKGVCKGNPNFMYANKNFICPQLMKLKSLFTTPKINLTLHKTQSHKEIYFWKLDEILFLIALFLFIKSLNATSELNQKQILNLANQFLYNKNQKLVLKVNSKIKFLLVLAIYKLLINIKILNPSNKLFRLKTVEVQFENQYNG